MGYRINVNYAALLQTANVIDQYIETHTKYISRGTQAVDELSVHWRGKDANQYVNYWQHMSDDSSISYRMLQSLKEYSEWLRRAAKIYRDAQETAINAAGEIPVL